MYKLKIYSLLCWEYGDLVSKILLSKFVATVENPLLVLWKDLIL